MTTAWMHVAAGRGALGAGLIVAFWLGTRLRRRELPPPTPEEQPRLPEGGPVREVVENREPDEVPRSDRRMSPHASPAFGNSPTRTGPEKQRPRWNEGGGDR